MAKARVPDGYDPIVAAASEDAAVLLMPSNILNERRVKVETANRLDPLILCGRGGDVPQQYPLVVSARENVISFAGIPRQTVALAAVAHESS